MIVKHKRIIGFILSFFIGSALTLVFVRVKYGEPIDSIKYLVYQETEGDFLVSILRILPVNQSCNLSEGIIKSFNQNSLIEVVDERYSVPRSFYFLKNKNGTFLLKSPIVKNNNEISLDNLYSYLIDLKVFNDFISAFYTKINKDSIIDQYCLLLSSIPNPYYYRKIKDSTDLSFITENFNKNNEMPLPEHKIINNIQEIINQSNKKGSAVYWFFDKGVLELTYKFSNQYLENIEVKFLGYLGNEKIHL